MRFTPIITTILLSTLTGLTIVTAKNTLLQSLKQKLNTMPDCRKNDPEALVKHKNEAGRHALQIPTIKNLLDNPDMPDDDKHKLKEMQELATQRRDHHTERVKQLILPTLPVKDVPDLPNTPHPRQIASYRKRAKNLHDLAQDDDARAAEEVDNASRERDYRYAGTVIERGAKLMAKSQRKKDSAALYDKKAEDGQMARKVRAGKAGQAGAGIKRKSSESEGRAGAGPVLAGQANTSPVVMNRAAGDAYDPNKKTRIDYLLNPDNSYLT
jgi:hypothetical protein